MQNSWYFMDLRTSSLFRETAKMLVITRFMHMHTAT